MDHVERMNITSVQFRVVFVTVLDRSAVQTIVVLRTARMVIHAPKMLLVALMLVHVCAEWVGQVQRVKLDWSRLGNRIARIF